MVGVSYANSPLFSCVMMKVLRGLQG